MCVLCLYNKINLIIDLVSGCLKLMLTSLKAKKVCEWKSWEQNEESFGIKNFFLFLRHGCKQWHVGENKKSLETLSYLQESDGPGMFGS